MKKWHSTNCNTTDNDDDDDDDHDDDHDHDDDDDDDDDNNNNDGNYISNLKNSGIKVPFSTDNLNNQLRNKNHSGLAGICSSIKTISRL